MKKLILIYYFLLLSIIIPNNIKAEPEQLLTKDQIVKTIARSEYDSGPLELKWGITDSSCNNSELFIAIHEESGNKFGGQHIATIYKKVDDKFKLLKRIHSFGCFLKPNLFWATPEGSNNKGRFLQLTESQYGTGHITSEHIFCIMCSGDIKAVKFIPATQTFTNQLKEDEGVLKGEINEFSDQGLFFTFYIWNKDDANCCPSAGEVTGSYKIVVKDLFNKEFEIKAKKINRDSIKQ